jgi:hypothetical protein
MRILVTLGLGALAMYLLDPQQGRRRRAFIRDRVGRVKGLVRNRPGGAVRDLSFREYATPAPVRSPESDTPVQAPESVQHLGR